MHFYFYCQQSQSTEYILSLTDVTHTGSGNHDAINASECCLKHLRLADTHRESVTKQTDRSAGDDPPPLRLRGQGQVDL